MQSSGGLSQERYPGGYVRHLSYTILLTVSLIHLLQSSEAPWRLIPFKPDWKKAEDSTPRDIDYYESSRALGELFRNVRLLDAPGPAEYTKTNGRVAPLSDSISRALRPYISRNLGQGSLRNSDQHVSEMEPLFRRYVDELRYICLTHALSDSPDDRLSEEEVVIGAILANCSQHRYRQDRMYRMRLNSRVLADDIARKLYMRVNEPVIGALRYGLGQAWLAWDFGTRNRGVFGASSFSLIALKVIMNILEDMGEITLKGGGGGTAPSEDSLPD